MGLMAAVAVVVAVLAALTLLPAVLAILGPRINSLRVRAPKTDADARKGLWAKLANDIAKQPVLAGLAALAILIPLTIPLFSLSLGQQDTAALSKSTTARQAYDLISKYFGPGVNGPLLIAVTLGTPAQASSSSSSSSSSGPGHRVGPGRARRADRRVQARRADRRVQARRADRRVEQLSERSRARPTRGCRLSRRTSPRLPASPAVTPIQIDQAGTTAYFNAISKNGPAGTRRPSSSTTFATTSSRRRRRAPT